MNRRDHDLHLHEQLLLLALRDEKGTLESRTSMYHYALGGAILSELLLAECVEIEEGKKKLVNLVARKRLGEPVLDECLGLVADAKRRRRAVDWVHRFGAVKRLRHRVAEGLCRKGVLKDSEDKVLFFFTRKVYPTIDPAPERRVVERLRKAVFGASRHLDPEVVVVAALAHGTGLLPIHFDKGKLKERKRRLEEIANGDLAVAATKEAVRAAQQAVQAAVAAALIASTVTTTVCH